MKIVMSKRERENIVEFVNNVIQLCDDGSQIKALEDFKKKLDNLEIPEDDFCQALASCNYIMRRTKNEARVLNSSFNGMKGEWSSIAIKIYAKASKVFLLKNAWTRNFYNNALMYIASFKQAYDDVLTKDFSDNKKEPEVRPSVDGNCIGGNCHQCTEYEDCPTGQMSEY